MNVFDILGPVMIGPSSSHTAGAVRIGRMAEALLSAPAVHAKVILHGSFAKTYKGHGTDKALIAGIMGMQPDDPRIPNSPVLAEQRGLKVEIIPGFIEGAHPNTARITLADREGNAVEIQGSSVGGGDIRITHVNQMPVAITGQQDALIVLHRDVPGVIAAVTDHLSRMDVNICSFHLSRTERGGTAVMSIEVDGHVEDSLNEGICRLEHIISSTVLRGV